MMRILLLDDDPLYCRTLAKSLQRHADFACEVVTATSVDEARQHVAAMPQPFDVFLIDQVLGPGPNGIEVMRELYTVSPSSATVIFTGGNDYEAGSFAILSGAYRYLQKPFKTDELVSILKSLREWRETRYERDWLRVLTEVSEEAQRVLGLSETAEVVVRGSQRLGFERARLWMLSDDRHAMIGLSQAGNQGLEGFTGIELPIGASPYYDSIPTGREPRVYRDQELGPLFLVQRYSARGFDPPVGEWVDLPLWSHERFLGSLILDNVTRPRVLQRYQIALLRLFGGQVSAALQRARLYENLRQLDAIGRLVSDRAAVAGLDEILREVHDRMGALLDASTCMVALCDDEHRLDVRLDVHQNRPRRRYWLPPGHGPLDQVIASGAPLLLAEPAATQQRRTAPRAWLGVPLLVEGHTIGALVVQSDTHDFTSEDLTTLEAIARQTAGGIQAAHAREQAAESSARLAVLHRAGELLIKLAETDEAHFWHAVLTVTTAHYGLRFNRALLWLVDEDNQVLHGIMGIGQFTREDAQRAWRRMPDAISTQSFDEYLQRPFRGRRQTPIERWVCQQTLAIAGTDAFATVLDTGRPIVMPSHEAAARLPATLVTRLGATDCAVLPLHVGDRRIGLLLVDNAHNREPLRQDRLNQLQTLTEQAALIAENQRQRAALAQQVRFTQLLMVKVSNQPPSATLSLICRVAQELTRADCVTIYTVRTDVPSGQYRFDPETAGQAGLLHPEYLTSVTAPDSSTTHLLATRCPRVVDDVLQLPDHDPNRDPEISFINRERVRSYMGIPVYDVPTGHVVGVMYLNYRKLHPFSPADVELAQIMARTAGAAIPAGRAGQDVRRNLTVANLERSARQRTLDQLQRVLAGALEPGMDEQRFAFQLLAAVQRVLERADVRATLVLRDWEPSQDEAEEPRRIRREFFLHPDGHRAHEIVADDGRGITGNALRRRRNRRIDDVTVPPWSGMFYAKAAEHTRSEMDILIRLNRRVLGLINVESPQVAAFSEADEQAIKRLAAAAALALDGVRRQGNLRTVLHAARAVVASSGLDRTLQAVIEAAVQIAPGVSALTIWYQGSEPGQILLGPVIGVRQRAAMSQRESDPDSVVRRVMQLDEPIWAQDARAEPRLFGRFVRDERLRAVAALPLRAEGETIGALFFNYRWERRFSDEERLLFPILAAIAAASIRDALRLEATRKERDRLHAAIEISRAVGTTLDPDATLLTVLRVLYEQFRDAQVAVLIFSSWHNTLSFSPASHTTYRIDFPDAIAHLDVAGDRSIACRAARHSIQTGQSKIEYVPDIHTDPGYLPVCATTQSELAVGLVSDGRLMGVLVLERPRTHAFTDDDIALVASVAQQISLALDRAYQSERLRFTSLVASQTAWYSEIAHDINREIFTIRNRADWLRDEPALTPRGQAWVDEIDASATVLQAAAHAPGSASAIDLPLDAWIEARVLELTSNARPGIAVELDLRCEPLLVRVSPLVLEHALRHLVRNAIEAMERQGTLTVRTRRRDETTAEVRIGDTGPGIAPEVRARMFSGEVTTKGPLRGRGLLLVRSMVEGMGGTIDVLPPEHAEGATFAFTLPVAAATDESGASR